MSLENFLIVAAIIFAIGLYGAMTKNNAITVLMCIELMFNAVNISAVAMSRYIVPASIAQDYQTANEIFSAVDGPLILNPQAADIAADSSSRARSLPCLSSLSRRLKSRSDSLSCSPSSDSAAASSSPTPPS